MLNQVIMVGVIEETRENVIELFVETPQSGNQQLIVVLGERLWDNTKDYVKVGMTVGVKAHLVNSKEGIQVVAEKLTFISDSKEGIQVVPEKSTSISNAKEE